MGFYTIYLEGTEISSGLSAMTKLILELELGACKEMIIFSPPDALDWELSVHITEEEVNIQPAWGFSPI